MAKTELKWNFGWFRTMRNSKAAKDVCLEQAMGIRAQCGADYTANVRSGKNRCHALVMTTSDEGAADNAKNNTLAKAMGGSL